MRESHSGGNRSVQVQVYPFRMTGENLALNASSPHMSFWKNIKQGYDIFEVSKTKPKWDVCSGDYSFNALVPVAHRLWTLQFRLR